MLRPHVYTAIAAAMVLTACGGSTAPPFATHDAQAVTHRRSTGSPLQHIIVMVQENRSFNNLFATFPGVTGSTTGFEKIVNGSKSRRKRIALTETRLRDNVNLNHLRQSFLIAWDKGAMDGFNNVIFSRSGHAEGTLPYEYVDPQDIQPYWTMASTYAIANAMFQTQGSGSFTAHQDLIRGGTAINDSESLIDDPSSAGFWGCDSPPGARTSVIERGLRYKRFKGPFPCTSSFPNPTYYKTLQDLLDTYTVPWKYYTPAPIKNKPGSVWNAFDAIAAVRYGPEWGTNVTWPETNVLTDITSGDLAAVSWVIPDGFNSDHPGYAQDRGPSWVASVVNAIGESPYWKSTAIVVVWDDWGGFYDPVAPPPRDHQGGPGFRVPLIVISPYTAFNASGGSPDISNTVYGFGSVVRFIEDTFAVGRLGTTDGTSNSIVDMFNFNQKPRKFSPIAAKYSRAYFLRQGPSGLPVDTE
jgi:phospholipase C